MPYVAVIFIRRGAPWKCVEIEAENAKFSRGVWELEVCVVCKWPVTYCICDIIHTGGD